tara:strand:- start:2032 stop:2463 length:432 start_codon:yes stop_codon:yes gene_type:complete
MASNLRVLVSNLGDGNWNTGNGTSANTTKYFPIGSNTDATKRFGGSIDYISWASKTNWLIQIDNTGGGSGTIQVLGHRPSGVAEELVPATAIGAGGSLSQGGVGGEEIYGPFTHFSFVSTSNSGMLMYYVTAWNYGDILDAGA